MRVAINVSARRESDSVMVVTWGIIGDGIDLGGAEKLSVELAEGAVPSRLPPRLVEAMSVAVATIMKRSATAKGGI